jgi:hypothetical protein
MIVQSERKSFKIWKYYFSCIHKINRFEQNIISHNMISESKLLCKKWKTLIKIIDVKWKKLSLWRTIKYIKSQWNFK